MQCIRSIHHSPPKCYTYTKIYKLEHFLQHADSGHNRGPPFARGSQLRATRFPPGCHVAPPQGSVV